MSRLLISPPTLTSPNQVYFCLFVIAIIGPALSPWDQAPLYLCLPKQDGTTKTTQNNTVPQSPSLPGVDNAELKAKRGVKRDLFVSSCPDAIYFRYSEITLHAPISAPSSLNKSFPLCSYDCVPRQMRYGAMFQQVRTRPYEAKEQAQT